MRQAGELNCWRFTLRRLKIRVILGGGPLWSCDWTHLGIRVGKKPPFETKPGKNLIFLKINMFFPTRYLEGKLFEVSHFHYFSIRPCVASARMTFGIVSTNQRLDVGLWTLDIGTQFLHNKSRVWAKKGLRWGQRRLANSPLCVVPSIPSNFWRARLGHSLTALRVVFACLLVHQRGTLSFMGEQMKHFCSKKLFCICT